MLSSFVPSKLFDCCAVGRPLIVAAGAEPRRLIANAGAGLGVDPGDSDALAASVRWLRDDPALRESLGGAARSFAAANLRERQNERMCELLGEGPVNATSSVVEASASEVPGQRIRVLILVDHPTLAGGGERLAVQTAARLNPDRFETTLCATRWDPSEAKHWVVASALAELEAAGVALLALTRRSAADLRPWPSLIRQLRGRRIDVVHSHKFGSNVWGAAVGRLAGVPVILCHEHSWSYSGRPLRRMLDRHLIARACDAFLAVSSEDARRMVEIEGIDSRDVLVLPNGIAPGRPTGRDVRGELGIAPDAPVIGAVGRLGREKAPHVLIEAAARLIPEFPQLHVVMVGDGPERARIATLADTLGIAGAVRLLGLRDDVPDILAALDLAVSSSEREGSPLSLIEYMAAGLPIVATAVGGVPDLILDGVHGRLVPPGAPVALADAVGELLRAPRLAEKMGRRARERQRREFDLDALVGRLERLYSELLAARASGDPRRQRTRATLAGLRSAQDR